MLHQFLKSANQINIVLIKEAAASFQHPIESESILFHATITFGQ